MNNRDGNDVNPTLARAALYANVFKPVASWVRSTGFRTHALRFRALGDSNDARIAEEFLVNSRVRRHERENELSIRGYFTDASIVMLSMMGYEENGSIAKVSLPKSARLRMELGEAFGWRRSVRHYTGDRMRLDHLAVLLRSAAGITAHAEVDLSDGSQATLRLRSTPSAGGLYPIDLHMAALNVEGLERGLYRYHPNEDKLWQTGSEPALDELLRAFDVPDELISISRANVIILLVGQPWRSMRKYGDRGLRYLFLEAGSMAQNINLATVALGYGSVECGSVYDDEAHEAMQLDGLYQALLHTVIVGSPG